MNFSFQATDRALAAGMLIERDGETLITEAGQFALAGLMANDDDAENKEHCATMIHRVMQQARAGGLEDQMAHVILWAFSEGINPFDDCKEGAQLANLCRYVTHIIGPGRMKAVMDGQKSH